MSKKSQILEHLKEGKSYDEIENLVEGSKRSYIRSLAYQSKKDLDNMDKGNNAKNDDFSDLFENDLVDNETKKETNISKGSNHKDWLKARKYECGCGCVIGRTTLFCPHCGKQMNWSGVE